MPCEYSIHRFSGTFLIYACLSSKLTFLEWKCCQDTRYKWGMPWESNDYSQGSWPLRVKQTSSPCSCLGCSRPFESLLSDVYWASKQILCSSFDHLGTSCFLLSSQLTAISSLPICFSACHTHHGQLRHGKPHACLACSRCPINVYGRKNGWMP